MFNPQFVKKLRLERGLSQEQIAKELNLSRPSYIEFERGAKELSVSEAETLASILDLSLMDLLAGEDKRIKTIVKFPKERKTYKKDRIMRINIPQKRLDKFREVLLYILEKVGANLISSVLPSR